MKITPNRPTGGVNLTMDAEAWRGGFTAGDTGRLMHKCPYRAGTTEAWSWCSGWIEGDAKRQGFSYSRGTLPAAAGDYRASDWRDSEIPCYAQSAD
ncbi:MAG TPA: hypothetical protein VKU19_13595 [Bryobacteraceae bacterium]|nr:hypothetical protein [Bryobacteraceae bacterium]